MERQEAGECWATSQYGPRAVTMKLRGPLKLIRRRTMLNLKLKLVWSRASSVVKRYMRLGTQLIDISSPF
jgi:hypothetical protein